VRSRSRHRPSSSAQERFFWFFSSDRPARGALDLRGAERQKANFKEGKTERVRRNKCQRLPSGVERRPRFGFDRELRFVRGTGRKHEF